MPDEAEVQAAAEKAGVFLLPFRLSFYCPLGSDDLNLSAKSSGYSWQLYK